MVMAGSVVQEILALAIVAAFAVGTFWSIWKNVLAEPVAAWLLKRGNVSAAMKVRAQIAVEEGTCGSSCGGGEKKSCS
jgi:hypothetical protein